MKTSWLFKKVLPFGVIFMLFGLMYTIVEQGILGNAVTYPSTGNPYYFTPMASAVMTFACGIIIGLIEVLYLDQRFKAGSLIRKILLKTAFYVLLISVLTFLISIFSHAIEQQKSPLDKEVLAYATNFVKNFAFWSVELYVGMGIGVALFYNEVSDNIGQGVLLNFLTGKYHKPIQEDRIFMFVDMKQSTSIAEELGHQLYFQMLKDYYQDLTDAIANNQAQIYQYVGDEVVLTWPVEKGIKEHRCLKSFFEMRTALNSRSEHYVLNYGVAPTFKAGLHLGPVTSGEIGTVKKEIIYTGDMLNATARLQGLCNSYGVDILASEDLSNALRKQDQFTIKSLGEVNLRGRDRPMRIVTIKARP